MTHLNKSLRRKLTSPKALKRNRNLNAQKKNVTQTVMEKSTGQSSSKDAEDSDNDCILVEKSDTHITIVDDVDEDNNDDDSDGSSNDDAYTTFTAGYQSMFQSFSNNLSSTPCVKKTLRNFKSSDTNKQTNTTSKSPVSHSPNRSTSPVGEITPFFVDVSGNAFLGSIQYNTRKPAKDPNDDDDDVVIIDDDNTTLTIKSTTRQAIKRKSSSSEESSSTSSGSSSEEDEEDGQIVGVNSKKGGSTSTADDSVVFVSETNNKDFIPINAATDAKVRVS